MNQQLNLFEQNVQQISTHTNRQILPWIQVAENAPYFITDDGKDWMPIGQNDAITWPELRGMFSRKDMSVAESYFQTLVQHGVTCLRLMLEYCQGEHRYFENPIGHFKPAMVRLWDDIFALCEKYGLRILLTPFDTFWMWDRWNKHPYNKKNGGTCNKRSQWLLCSDTREAIKGRLKFAAERWGSSGVLFAWDIWNEIHPAHAENSSAVFNEFVDDISSFLRKTEISLYGKSHPQTVSVFGPVLCDPAIVECTFRHNILDFASVHFYEHNTINNPRNTVDPAISTGRLTRNALKEIENYRPFFDSEHGPIHSFKDKRKTLSVSFDDEYFLHMQWAHFASGGAGGGMRWPNRHPHSLTRGMRKAQLGLSRFLPLINWKQFRRKNLNEEIILKDKSLIGFCCGDQKQAILWVLKNKKNRQGMVKRDSKSAASSVQIPGLQPGKYKIVIYSTDDQVVTQAFEVIHGNEYLQLDLPPITSNVAFAIRKIYQKSH